MPWTRYVTRSTPQYAAHPRPALIPRHSMTPQKDPERFKTLYDGVADKLFGRLPDATWVYPGHGSDTTIGAERPHLAEWRERGW
jgi:glyoxylase-like metal-dependent hydrolase (beta-lactamase superfamily II)